MRRFASAWAWGSVPQLGQHGADFVSEDRVGAGDICM